MTWIPRGHASVQLKVVRHRNTPDFSDSYVYDMPAGGPHGNPQMASSILILYADGHVQ